MDLSQSYCPGSVAMRLLDSSYDWCYLLLLLAQTLQGGAWLRHLYHPPLVHTLILSLHLLGLVPLDLLQCSFHQQTTLLPHGAHLLLSVLHFTTKAHLPLCHFLDSGHLVAWNIFCEEKWVFTGQIWALDYIASCPSKFTYGGLRPSENFAFTWGPGNVLGIYNQSVVKSISLHVSHDQHPCSTCSLNWPITLWKAWLRAFP